MKVSPIKTKKIIPGEQGLLALLDESISSLEENTVIAVTSKIISLCEGRFVSLDKANKEDLIKQESSQYLPSNFSDYGYHFSITNNTLISSAGIDESNGQDNYILWPKDPQESANKIRKYLSDKFDLTNIGVVVTDSTCSPLRYGTIGIAIAHSGFEALRDYVGSPDLFGKNFKVSRANIAGGLAASATAVMGEGTEQTPICIITEVPHVTFQKRNPTKQELVDLRIPLNEDLFAPFFKAVNWQPGDKSS